LYQISYILVKENVIKSDKISLKFMQKRITFVFTECYKHFAKKNTQKPGFNHLTLRAYPNNPLYCGRLQSPMPALSAKNVLNVEKTTPPSIFGLPPWPRTFRPAS